MLFRQVNRRSRTSPNIAASAITDYLLVPRPTKLVGRGRESDETRESCARSCTRGLPVESSRGRERWHEGDGFYIAEWAKKKKCEEQPLRL